MKTTLSRNDTLTGAIENLTGETLGLRGKVHSHFGGNVHGLTGNCTGLTGNCTGIRGNIDDCELTDEERDAGVDIASLVPQTEETVKPAVLDNGE